jgi:hypothetical protein
LNLILLNPLRSGVWIWTSFGLMTNQRNVLNEDEKVYLERNPGRQVVAGKHNRMNVVVDHYKEAKVCFVGSFI